MSELQAYVLVSLVSMFAFKVSEVQILQVFKIKKHDNHWGIWLVQEYNILFEAVTYSGVTTVKVTPASM